MSIRNVALAATSAFLLLLVPACATQDPAKEWAVAPSLSPEPEGDQSAPSEEVVTPTDPATGTLSTTVEASGIPTQWYKKAKKAWPKSDGYKSDTAILTNSECKVTSKLPKILDQQMLATNAGFGAYGPSSKGIKHLCSMTTSDNTLVGQLTYLYTPDKDTFYASVEAFNDQATDSHATVTAAPVSTLDITVSRVWDPSLKVGSTEAMYFSEGSQEIAYLKVTGLTEDQFKKQNAKAQAKALARLFG